MTFALVACFILAGVPQCRTLAADMTYQQCKADLALLHSEPGIRLVCETET
jgi:hypothetical protein